MRTDKFDRYVDLARNGTNGWPRIIGVVVLVALVAVLGIVVAIAAVAMLSGRLSQAGEDPTPAFRTPLGVAASLLAIATIWLGLWAGLRLVHRRTLGSVIGRDRWSGGNELVAGLVVGLSIPLVFAVLAVPLGPVPVRSDVPVGMWLLIFLPVAAIVLLQASAEEALFRGYLPQVLASRGLGPLAWLVVPTVLFTGLHWYDGVPLWKNLCVFAMIGVFALAMMILVVRTGRIAAACGLHWGNNIVALQVVALDDELGSAALYHLPPLVDPAWNGMTLGSAVALAVVMTAIQLALLLHARSPVRITDG